MTVDTGNAIGNPQGIRRLSGLIPLADLINHQACGVIPVGEEFWYSAALRGFWNVGSRT
jgi:hypothetical protein